MFHSKNCFFNPFKKKTEAGESSADNDSAEGEAPKASPLGKVGSPLGLAKDMYNVTKAAKEMAKVANAHKGGKEAFAESQLAQVKSLLEMQRQMAKSAGPAGKSGLDSKQMAKMMEQSSALFEQMVGPLEEKLRTDKSGPSPSEIAAAAAAGYKKLPTANSPPSSPSSGASPASSPLSATAATDQAAAADSALAPEIAELFAELRAMRKKRNDYRDKYDAADKELSATRERLRIANAHEADMQQRLAKAEAKASELHSRNLELDDAKDQLTSQMKKLSTELSKAQPAAAKAAQAQQKQLELELSRAKQRETELNNELVRAERKLRRLRRQSPMGDVSELLSDLSRLGTETEVPFGDSAASAVPNGSDPSFANASSSSSSLSSASGSSGGGANDEDGSNGLQHAFRSAIADEAFEGVRDKYERLVSLRFPEDSKECNTGGAIARVALEVIRARVPWSMLDCVVVAPNRGAANTITKMVEQYNEKNGAHWSVSLAEIKSGGWSVTVSESSDAVFNAADSGSGGSDGGNNKNIVLGPYGFFAAYVAVAQQDQQKQQLQQQAQLAVYPTASQALLDNPRRSTILTDKARSSKPGGQAANVSETKITHRLLIDGALFASSTSQDSRSAMHNKDTAMERLMSERVPAVNQKLRQVRKLVLAPAAKTVVVPSLVPCVEGIAATQDPLTAAAVQCVLMQTTPCAASLSSSPDEKKD